MSVYQFEFEVQAIQAGSCTDEVTKFDLERDLRPPTAPLSILPFLHTTIHLHFHNRTHSYQHSFSSMTETQAVERFGARTATALSLEDAVPYLSLDGHAATVGVSVGLSAILVPWLKTKSILELAFDATEVHWQKRLWRNDMFSLAQDHVVQETATTRSEAMEKLADVSVGVEVVQAE
ncbi:hypothetical protein CPC08DRAFT_767911 [Agrocybe pediades]|nr:hypothetical protein CPC08DRAFT_767911 [Agrocybe pediades]